MRLALAVLPLVLIAPPPAMALSPAPPFPRYAQASAPQDPGPPALAPPTPPTTPAGKILPPILVHQGEAQFSEQARRAKFSGKVSVYLVVDENGDPTHIRVYRSAGMGLDEKAVEAVRQYKFKPATRDGKPVKVPLWIDVDFKTLTK